MTRFVPLATAVLVALACNAQAAPQQPNILLISVDTLRADRMSHDGHGQPTSPFVDGLAAQGIRFAHAYSTSSWTTPSVVSMLSSTYQSKHRMGARLEGIPRVWNRIPEALPNLPAILREHGYRTYALVTNTNLEAKRGFDRGFDRYRCLGVADVEEVEKSLGGFVRTIAAEDGPWFFWLHLMDPHAPYRGRDPWVDDFSDDHKRFPHLDPMGSERFSKEASRYDRRKLEVVRAIYDSEIRDSDELLRRLFERIPGADKALTLFTSDHGEEFLEHGGTLHGRTLFEESIRIPFVVRLPDRRLAGTVVDEAVSLVDVLPTLLGGAGIEPPAGVAGIDLIGDEGVNAPADRYVVAELLRGDPWRAVTDGRWKIILRDDHEDGIDLFDLERDPAEQRDESSRPAQAERVAAFREFVAAFERQHAADGKPLEQIEISPEQLEALKALGYIGTD